MYMELKTHLVREDLEEIFLTTNNIVYYVEDTMVGGGVQKTQRTFYRSWE